MNANKKRRIPVKVELIVRTTCHICDIVQKELEYIIRAQSNVDLVIVEAESATVFPGNSQPYVTPAVWVNDRLWYLGGFDSSGFVKKLKRLSQ